MLLHFRRSPMGWFGEPVSVPKIHGPLRNSAKTNEILMLLKMNCLCTWSRWRSLEFVTFLLNFENLNISYGISILLAVKPVSVPNSYVFVVWFAHLDFSRNRNRKHLQKSAQKRGCIWVGFPICLPTRHFLEFDFAEMHVKTLFGEHRHP